MHGKSEQTHLMSVVADEAAGGAHPGDSIRHAGEAGEHGLALEVPAGVGALLAVVAAQHQIRLQLLGLDALDVLADGDRGLRLVCEGVLAVARRVGHALPPPRPATLDRFGLGLGFGVGVRGPGLRASSRDWRDWREMGDASQAGELRLSRGEVERNTPRERKD